MYTISAKQENKGATSILAMTGQLSQVLKQFGGLYGQTLKGRDGDTLGLTVEEWLADHGMYRAKNKCGQKTGYTPGSVFSAWIDEMKLVDEAGKTTCNVFKNIPAQYVPTPEQCVEWGLAKDDDEDAQITLPVYTEEEAMKANGKPIARYELVPVGGSDWSVRTILKGLKQCRNYKKEDSKSEKLFNAWDKLEKCYVVVDTKGENGEVSRTLFEVAKSEVTFDC